MTMATREIETARWTLKAEKVVRTDRGRTHMMMGGGDGNTQRYSTTVHGRHRPMLKLLLTRVLQNLDESLLIE